MKQRKNYFDTIKLFAIFVVFATHFIASYHSAYFDLWHTMPYAVILKGVSGKFGVVVFSVILGYFAYKSSDRNIIGYAVKRYLYFLLCALFINSIYAVCGHFGYLTDPVGLRHLLVSSVMLDDDIFATLWCLRPFLAASILARICGKYKAGIPVLAAGTALLLYLNYTWIAIGLMGGIAACLEENSFFKRLMSHRMARIAAYLAAFGAVKLANYPAEGITAAIALAALPQSTLLVKPLENKKLASAGRNTMAIYLIHPAIYSLVGDLILTGPYSGMKFLAGMAVSWIVIVAVSYPVTKLLDTINAFLRKGVDLVCRPFVRRAKEESPQEDNRKPIEERPNR